MLHYINVPFRLRGFDLARVENGLSLAGAIKLTETRAALS